MSPRYRQRLGEKKDFFKALAKVSDVSYGKKVPFKKRRLESICKTVMKVTLKAPAHFLQKNRVDPKKSFVPSSSSTLNTL
jgi:hypothetical protein